MVRQTGDRHAPLVVGNPLRRNVTDRAFGIVLLKPLQELGCLALCVQADIWVRQRHGAEGARADREDLALDRRLHGAQVGPRHPEHRLREPHALRDRNDPPYDVRQVHALVEEGARDEEVHVLCRDALVKDHVALGEAVLRNCLVTDLADARLADLGVLLEERVDTEEGQIDLPLQRYGQRARKQLEEGNFVLGCPPLVRIHRQLDVPGDPGRELAGDMVLLEEFPQEEPLGGKAGCEASQPRHGGGDAAHKGGEHDNGDKQDGHSEQPFQAVDGEHPHGGWSELRHRPVEGYQVLLRRVFLEDAVLHHPTPGPRRLSYEEPATRNVVVDHQEADQVLPQPHQDGNALGPDLLVYGVQELAQLHEAQQPQRPQDPHDAEELPQAREAQTLARGRAQVGQLEGAADQIDPNDRSVQEKPSLDVPLRD
mmetsp:Transcript_25772/g.81838  ORF Transcript_25772/g.81838 Transcript_25772/m.81838 type:complete len:426 (+) Transcript_25772:1301-2578(+)